MIKITINNKEYNVKKDLTILQACEQFNIIVPRFCYHEKLSVAGNCRMCLVEVNKSPKPVASCAMPLMPNMVIYTETPLVKKAREAVLEFLLINHPLDCPICDQGGECDLQDITLNYGSDRSRFFELKRGVEDKECGPIIKTIMTRCIHCTRCIRFISEIAGLDCLGTLGRGENTEIGTYINKFIKTELSGNLVDLCPVGALTSKPYAFSTRTWELKKYESIDFTDSMGSNVVIYTRNNAPLKNYKFKNDYENKDEILRILPKLNDNINENWISDKTRYSFDGYKYNRSKNIKIKSNLYNNKNISWSKLLSFKFIKNDKFKNNLGFIGSIIDIESLFFFRTFLKTINNKELNILSNNRINKFNTDLPNFYLFNSKFKAIDSSDLILLIGVNPRYEASMLNVRIRKQISRKNITVGLIGSPNDLTYNTHHIGSSTKSLFKVAEGKHSFCKKLRQAKNPLIIVGSEINYRKDSGALNNLIRFISKKSLVNLKNFNGLNNIHLNLNEINSCELNIKPSYNSQLYISTNKNLNSNYFNNTNLQNRYFLLNENLTKKDILGNNTEIISLNTHKLFNIKHKLNYTIPITGHFEKNNLNINSEGTIQKSFKSISPPVDSRNVDDILRAFIKLSFNKKEVLHKFTNKNLIKKNPFLNKLNQSRINFYVDYLNIKETQNKVYLNNFKSVVNNFYMTDSISENSQIMAECSLFMNNKYNFIKNNI